MPDHDRMASMFFPHNPVQFESLGLMRQAFVCNLSVVVVVLGISVHIQLTPLIPACLSASCISKDL
ncbi:hypothetical protein K504DRAFT_161573 [Pleomassaria siparia CBS 279.74]|uniref:Uncharacterized protein n=1 Tax=Pleomassaria siparia CBS 279.74 TaxID=1314801 RepID=A0A6G1JUS3_9PLEO|nr:hypothetical protein K504DRAFT_161573 [Pleomassaria siparia CBS 279.74]